MAKKANGLNVLEKIFTTRVGRTSVGATGIVTGSTVAGKGIVEIFDGHLLSGGIQIAVGTVSGLGSFVNLKTSGRTQTTPPECISTPALTGPTL